MTFKLSTPSRACSVCGGARHTACHWFWWVKGKQKCKQFEIHCPACTAPFGMTMPVEATAS